MGNLLQEAYHSFLLYIADGWHFITFAALFVYLWITEKDKNKRIVLLYISVLVMFIFFFPLTTYLLFSVLGEGETYYRIMWFVPITIIIAYGFVKVVSSQKSRIQQVMLSLIIASLLMVGGDFVYDNEFFQKTQNYYQLPQVVVEICDSIEVEGREVRAVFPKELLEYVRQYSATVHMPYGREMLVERWNNYNELYDVMEGEVIMPNFLVELAREQECHYIILHEGDVSVEAMAENKYKRILEVGGYEVYLDETAYLGLDY